MPTTWNAIYLGVTPILDPTEGNGVSENAASLVGTTFGAANDNLFDEVVSIQAINVGGSSTSLDMNNSLANDQMQFDLGDGAGTVTTVYDGGGSYQGTITYTDSTTWTGLILIAQDSLGNTFLVPQVNLGAPQSALVAKPIESITINSLTSATFAGLQLDRQTTNFLTCFTSGTGVLTPDGVRQIETLVPGDLVMTYDHGAQPLRWIGQTVTRGQGDHAPICFAPGAIGNDRALRVSPQHRMLVTDWRAELLFGEAEVLVPAKFLVGCPGVTVAPCGAVTYLHLMFDSYEMVLADGAWSESFFPGDQALASDAAHCDEIQRLFPALAACTTSYGPTARRVLIQPETRILLAKGPEWAIAA